MVPYGPVTYSFFSSLNDLGNFLLCCVPYVNLIVICFFRLVSFRYSYSIQHSKISSDINCRSQQAFLFTMFQILKIKHMTQFFLADTFVKINPNNYKYNNDLCDKIFLAKCNFGLKFDIQNIE